ncbi:transcriptional regulator, TetR family [Flavobacteriaceae bacterium MAR_2010_188]|nr:transcriptional regulator, TetR family [Flavobacteriaceae bacterium MAR_2010_188]
MREKILHGSIELFLDYGFKSVTMDDIANHLGISKKTIYQYFDTKTKLVEATTMNLFNNISKGIDCIRELDKNPIAEIFDIKKFINEHLKNEKSSPQYQLKKYYPKIYSNLKNRQFEIMQDCVVHNLKKGVDTGLYRESIDIEFISRIYFSGMVAIKDIELFPLKRFSMDMLLDHYLEYHLRGICSDKGLETLETFTKTTKKHNETNN